MTYHSAVSLDRIETSPNIVIMDDLGIRMPRKHVLRLIAESRAKGFTYWPPCDHVTPEGRCAGHEEKTE